MPGNRILRVIRYPAAALLLLLAAGCATAPGLHEDADPIRLLPRHTRVAVSIPVVEHRTGLQQVVPELFEGELSAVLQRTSRITVGRASSDERVHTSTEIQHMVVEGAFTANTLRFGLPRRRGWSRERAMGVRYYRRDDMAVVLLEPGLIYAVAGGDLDLHIEAAVLRAGRPVVADHPVPALGSVSDARIWWSSAAGTVGVPDGMPAQLREFLDTGGWLDYTMRDDGSVLLQGRLLASTVSTARALNVTLRFVLPQLLDMAGRPAIERQGTEVLLHDIEITPEGVREWAVRLLVDFFE